MGVFVFFTNDLYNLAMAMVFGLTTSMSIWEPFQWAIKSLSKVVANCPNLVQKHKKYLDMIGWAELNPDIPITPVFA